LLARCTALSTELDDDTPESESDAVPRSPEHTSALSEAVGGNIKGLWEGYGIIADIVVCSILFNINFYFY
jgi:hypothetical protein